MYASQNERIAFIFRAKWQKAITAIAPAKIPTVGR